MHFFAAFPERTILFGYEGSGAYHLGKRTGNPTKSGAILHETPSSRTMPFLPSQHGQTAVDAVRQRIPTIHGTTY
jgi:hypothetical protein